MSRNRHMGLADLQQTAVAASFSVLVRMLAAAEETHGIAQKSGNAEWVESSAERVRIIAREYDRRLSAEV